MEDSEGNTLLYYLINEMIVPWSLEVIIFLRNVFCSGHILYATKYSCMFLDCVVY